MWRHPKYYKELRKRNKLDQAISNSHVIKDSSDRLERAPWSGPQASSFKHQTSSIKRQAHRDSSIKRQASSVEAQASSFKPQASSSMIREPRKSFTVPGPRASTMINVLLGCFT